ncbi:DUF6328 family protein [Modestobacter sp. NPDC049651]|uniref:DUF6328 family protein n=1 Tax=unclassified Modestobacter TaxID=2643866 RepID=UPI00341004EB
MGRKRSDAQGSARDRGESTDEVLDRNVAELLQETRVATAGVQFLFAFELTLPFTQRFGELRRFGTTVYTVSLLSTALAALVLLAPVAFHRVLFRQHEKRAVVAFADRCLIIGLALVLVGIASAVLLVLDVVLGRAAAVTACAAIGAAGLLIWFLLPAGHRLRSRRDD